MDSGITVTGKKYHDFGKKFGSHGRQVQSLVVLYRHEVAQRRQPHCRSSAGSGSLIALDSPAFARLYNHPSAALIFFSCKNGEAISTVPASR